MQNRRPQYTVIAKPIGPICNLSCRYCYYLEKKQLYQKKESFRMSPQVLEAFIKQCIESQDAPEVEFPWQGGFGEDLPPSPLQLHSAINAHHPGS